jgi:hypothetical protein
MVIVSQLEKQMLGGRLMQDKYVGDIGDYGKFGLLRSLSTKLKND